MKRDGAIPEGARTAPFAPIEAKLVGELPDGPGWQYEPKWDGFRAVVVKDGAMVDLWSKSGRPLGRYFPEIVSLVAGIGEERLTFDGELIIPVGDALSLDALQARLHPATSRVERLSRETPAQLMLFDCMGFGGTDLAGRPLGERRTALERLHARHRRPDLLLSPASASVDDARAWLAASGGALDGVVAKRLDEPYRAGERAMLKVKQHRTADCVVGGFRRIKGGREVASLLLGLHDDQGLLDHVGFCSGIADADRAALTERLEPLIGRPGFDGKAPGGPSRWNGGKESEWEPLRPELVVEVVYDQVTAGRFRHGTRILRWRPDKDPRQCTADQLVPELRPAELERLL